MSTFEVSVLVVGIVALLRKARPTLDGWGVVAAALMAAVSVAFVKNAMPTWHAGPLLILLERGAEVAGVAFGLVFLADRISTKPTIRVHTAVLPTADGQDRAPTIHRLALVGAIALVVAVSSLYGCVDVIPVTSLDLR